MRRRLFHRERPRFQVVLSEGYPFVPGSSPKHGNNYQREYAVVDMANAGRVIESFVAIGLPGRYQGDRAAIDKKFQADCLARKLNHQEQLDEAAAV